jgi:hypothetical protein
MATQLLYYAYEKKHMDTWSDLCRVTKSIFPFVSGINVWCLKFGHTTSLLIYYASVYWLEFFFLAMTCKGHQYLTLSLLMYYNFDQAISTWGQGNRLLRTWTGLFYSPTYRWICPMMKPKKGVYWWKSGWMNKIPNQWTWPHNGTLFHDLGTTNSCNVPTYSQPFLIYLTSVSKMLDKFMIKLWSYPSLLSKPCCWTWCIYIRCMLLCFKLISELLLMHELWIETL